MRKIEVKAVDRLPFPVDCLHGIFSVVIGCLPCRGTSLLRRILSLRDEAQIDATLIAIAWLGFRTFSPVEFD